MSLFYTAGQDPCGFAGFYRARTFKHTQKTLSKGSRPRPSGRGYLSVKIRAGGGSFLLQHIITEA